MIYTIKIPFPLSSSPSAAFRVHEGVVPHQIRGSQSENAKKGIKYVYFTLKSCFKHVKYEWILTFYHVTACLDILFIEEV